MEKLKIRGVIKFVNPVEKSPDRVRITLSLDDVDMIETLKKEGVKVKEYTRDGVTDFQVSVSLFRDSDVSYQEEGQTLKRTYNEFPLKWGDRVTCVCKIVSYEVSYRKGKCLRLIGIGVNEFAKRGGLTDEEILDLFNE